MNEALKGGLAELKAAGAQDLPTVAELEGAEDGTTWTGTKANGEPWTLTKGGCESCDCEC